MGSGGGSASRGPADQFGAHLLEPCCAPLDHRRPLDLYHSALEVTVPEGRFVIEDLWPIPKATGASRGVTVAGPVWNRHLGRFRAFRYEVRRWYEGTIADADEAVESPRRLSDDEDQARRVLAMTVHVPAFVWGRDELGIGEMWNRPISAVRSLNVATHSGTNT